MRIEKEEALQRTFMEGLEDFTALLPDGWHDITLEVRWEPTGPGCRCISAPGFGDSYPVGLLVKI